MTPLPRLALVGRSNVGKSTLFNRICGQRKAITDGRPGSTRDRNYAQVTWQGAAFEIIDTGGLLLGTDDPLLGPASEQAQRAIEEADVVLFLVDGRAGLLPDDEAIARQLRRDGKRVIVVVNKAEAGESAVNEFARLGFDETLAISAEHGLGVGDLLDAALAGSAARGSGRAGHAAGRSGARRAPERRQVVAAQPARRPRAGRRLGGAGHDPRHGRRAVRASRADLSSRRHGRHPARAPAQGERRPRERRPGAAGDRAGRRGRARARRGQRAARDGRRDRGRAGRGGRRRRDCGQQVGSRGGARAPAQGLRAGRSRRAQVPALGAASCSCRRRPARGSGCCSTRSSGSRRRAGRASRRGS